MYDIYDGAMSILLLKFLLFTLDRYSYFSEQINLVRKNNDDFCSNNSNRMIIFMRFGHFRTPVPHIMHNTQYLQIH